jgi:hypothetical protein
MLLLLVLLVGPLAAAISCRGEREDEDDKWAALEAHYESILMSRVTEGRFATSEQVRYRVTTAIRDGGELAKLTVYLGGAVEQCLLKLEERELEPERKDRHERTEGD